MQQFSVLCGRNVGLDSSVLRLGMASSPLPIVPCVLPVTISFMPVKVMNKTPAEPVKPTEASVEPKRYRRIVADRMGIVVEAMVEKRGPREGHGRATLNSVAFLLELVDANRDRHSKDELRAIREQAVALAVEPFTRFPVKVTRTAVVLAQSWVSRHLAWIQDGSQGERPPFVRERDLAEQKVEAKPEPKPAPVATAEPAKPAPLPKLTTDKVKSIIERAGKEGRATGQAQRLAASVRLDARFSEGERGSLIGEIASILVVELARGGLHFEDAEAEARQALAPPTKPFRPSDKRVSL